LNIETRKEIANRNIETGYYLHKLRLKIRYTLAESARKIDISPTYLSDIEHGRKLPSDSTIRKLAELYDIDEIDLFNMFGKISLTVLEVLRNDLRLQREIYNMMKDGKIGR